MSLDNHLLQENNCAEVKKETCAEAARRIYRDHSLSVREKHHAWQDMIASCHDEAVCVRNYGSENLEQISLHGLLRSYMAEQKSVESRFFTDEPDVVYLCELRCLSTKECIEIREPSLSWEGCVQKIADYQDWEMIPGRYRAVATKFWPKPFADGFFASVQSCFYPASLRSSRLYL